MMGDNPGCTQEVYEYMCDQNADRLPVDNGWTGNRGVDGKAVQEEFERRGIKW